MKNEIELIEIAKSSSDKITLAKLSDSIFISVRRSVAKNFNTSKEILERLCFDPSFNVSYIARQREGSIIPNTVYSHPCVTCTVDEKNYSSTCSNCSLIRNYRN